MNRKINMNQKEPQVGQIDQDGGFYYSFDGFVDSKHVKYLKIPLCGYICPHGHYAPSREVRGEHCKECEEELGWEGLTLEQVKIRLVTAYYNDENCNNRTHAADFCIQKQIESVKSFPELVEILLKDGGWD